MLDRTKNEKQNKLLCKTLAFFRSGLSALWIALFVIALDRLTKLWVLSHLVLFEPLRVFAFFNLTLAYNRGAAFSFLDASSGWQNILLGSLAVCISILILVWLYRLPQQAYWRVTALCFVLGGALANAWDRVLYGYVIDFLDFHWNTWHFAIFNIADSAICIGAFMLIVSWVREY